MYTINYKLRFEKAIKIVRWIAQLNTCSNDSTVCQELR